MPGLTQSDDSRRVRKARSQRPQRPRAHDIVLSGDHGGDGAVDLPQIVAHDAQRTMERGQGSHRRPVVGVLVAVRVGDVPADGRDRAHDVPEHRQQRSEGGVDIEGGVDDDDLVGRALGRGHR